MRNLRVRLLGDLQVEGHESARLGRRQVRTTLKLLALHHDQPVTLDRMVDCLWRDTPPARPADQVSVLVSRLRVVVGADRVRRTDAGYMLSLDWLDLDALKDYVHESERRLAGGAVGAARAAASAGLSLVRGPFLADEPDCPWADVERAAVDRLISRLRQAGTAAALAAGDWTTAAELGHRAVEADPYDEQALRALMEALARSGRPASALAAYAKVRVRLAEELGVSPSEATETLHTAILLGEIPETARVELSDGAAEELPGRAGAIRQLDDLLDRAEQGDGQVGLVEGEAGIGKSLLLQVWSRRAAGRAVVVGVACDELGRALPFQPLLDAVDLLIRRRGAGSAGHILGPGGAVLGPFLSGHGQPAATAQLAVLTDPGAGQSLLLAALFSVLVRQAEHETLVVVIDDIHLADAATMAWLGQAARRLAGARVAVVVGRRSEEADVPLPGVTTIALGPLDLEAATAVVGSARAAELHARSAGHPMFLAELAAAGESTELPASIRDAVEARCMRAGVAGTTLRTAAVIGPEVDLDLITAVMAVSPRFLLDHLEEGVRRRFLIEEGTTFVFAHSLIREALASTVGASRAAFVHREAALALASRAGADPLAVARHARLGGELPLASRMLVTAGRLSVARFDHEEALRLLDEAMTLDDTADARLERARVRSMLAHYQGAGEDLEAAEALGAGPEVTEVAAWSAHFQRRFDEALSLADRGAEQATDGDLRTSCLALGGWVSLAAGDLDGAETRLEGALGEAPEASGRLAEAWMAWLRVNQGRPAETLRLVKPKAGEGLATYRFPNAYALMAATMASAMLGRPDEALATLERLSADVTRMGALRWLPRPLNLRGWIVRNLGVVGEADELNRAAIEEARNQGLVEPLANGLLDLAAGRLMMGDFGAAGALVDEAAAVSEVEHAFRWRHRLRERLIRCRLALATGDSDDAFAGAEALAADAGSLRAARYETQARVVSAMAARRMSSAVDLDEVGVLLLRLDGLAGLEAWWITAEAAEIFGIDRWERLARSRVASLARRAGPYEAALTRAASERLR